MPAMPPCWSVRNHASGKPKSREFPQTGFYTNNLQLDLQSEEFVLQLAAGDETAIAQFVRYFGRLIGYKLRMRSVEPELIDEVRQETFIRVLFALRKDGGLRDHTKLGAFVNTTCNHVLSEHFRRSVKTLTLSTDSHDAPSDGADAEQGLLLRERDRQVRDVVNRLPVRDRKVLEAIFLQERDKDEVCAEFGIDRNYLRVMLHRAKQNFRQKFEN